MTTLNQRQTELLRHLMRQDHDVTVSSLASLFSVSSRTIRNDLNDIRYYLKDFDAELRSEPHKGIRLICVEAEKADILQHAIASRSPSPEERIARMSLELLCNDVCTYESLAHACQISRQTIISCFPNVEKQFENNHLSISKEKGNGIFVSGKEIDFRELFVETISSMQDDAETIQAMQWAKEGGQKTAWQLLRYARDTLHVTCYDPEKTALIVQYGLYRSAHNHNLAPADLPGIISPEELQACSKKLQGQFPAKLPETERLWTVSILLQNIAGNDGKPGISQDASRLARYLMNRLQVLHPLNGDEKQTFVNGLGRHLETALFRLRNHIPVQNVMTEQIQISIPLIYEYTKLQLVNCEKKYGVTFDDNETAYIAMYIASAYESSSKMDISAKVLIVCSFGTTTSAILAARMRQTMPECQIIGPTSRQEAEAYLKDNPVDLIVCTDGARQIAGYPVVQVNPLLSHDNIELLRSQLDQITYEKMCGNFLTSYKTIHNNETNRKSFIHDFMSSDEIQILDRVDSWQSAIEIAAAPLLREGKLEQHYIDRMIEAVNRLGTYMVIVPGTAFVHAGTSDGIHADCSSLLVLKKPIIFGDHDAKRVSNIVVTGVLNREKTALLDLVYIFAKEANQRLLQEDDITKEIILNLNNGKEI